MSVDNLPEITLEQAVKFILSVNQTPRITTSVSELVYSFIRAGYIENIRWDVALAQSIHETGYFKYGGQVKPEQNNFAGIGVLNGGAGGATFETVFKGALAQIQHLKGYANKDELVHENVDPRFKYVTRGHAPYLEWLGQKENPRNNSTTGLNIGWAVPGDNYGKNIRSILDRMRLI